jgi:hypothetical protein
MDKFKARRALQAEIMPLAERALGFQALNERRSAINQSIFEAADDLSGKKKAGLINMFTALAEAPKARTGPARVTEGGTLTGGSLVTEAELIEARRVIAEADAANKPKGHLLEDLAKLSREDFAHVLEESQRGTSRGASPYWRPRGPAAPQVSESAPTATGRTKEAIDADWARLPGLPLIEQDERRRALMEEYARSVPFGGRRLVES